jgi:hypothetical protein
MAGLSEIEIAEKRKSPPFERARQAEKERSRFKFESQPASDYEKARSHENKASWLRNH